MAVSQRRRVLVTGGASYLGYSIAAALVAEGADVTLLIRPGGEDRLGPLAQHVQWWTADVWDTASLRGRARGHHIIIHTIGSMIALPEQGLTYQRMNFVSARNVATMCVSDGVQEMILLSSVRSPWLNRQYVRSKHDAEQYIGRVGIRGTIVRAPIVYARGQRRVLFFRLMTLMGGLPPISWLGLNRIAPMPIDILARGIARIALEPTRNKTVYYAPDLRQRNRREERSAPLPAMPISPTPNLDDTQPKRPTRIADIDDEEIPFGWKPTDPTGKR